MKIVILGPAYPYRGGIAAFNERIAYQLMEEGHEVEILTFTVQYPSFLFPGKTQYSESPAPAGLSIERVANSCNPFNWIKVGRKIRKMNPDMLIVKFWIPLLAPCLGTISRIAKRNKNIKVISILDNIVPHEKRFADKLLAKYFVNSIDAFIAMSDSVMKDVKALDSKNKPKLFSPHPLYDHFGEQMTKQEATEHLGLDVDTNYVLFFGFIREYKGLDWLIEAMSDSRLKNVNLKLIVAGEFYGDSSKYTKLAEDCGLSDKIIWRTDFIPDEEVKYYFNVADLVAQPYKTATQSGVTQIAYHFEKPMLVTNVGGLAEIIPDGKVGYVVAPEVNAIADAIFDFFSSEKYHAFDEGIKVQKNRFSWSEMTKSCYKLLS